MKSETLVDEVLTAVVVVCVVGVVYQSQVRYGMRGGVFGSGVDGGGIMCLHGGTVYHEFAEGIKIQICNSSYSFVWV